ncbi:MAG: IS200/IS605 family transposase [Prevotellamassilia sp.]|nr:IS200/IS605 family transposase [Prevotellamassilia sp.]
MSYTSLLYHIVFRTHCSVPTITEEYEKELYKFIYGFVKGKGCVLHRIGGMPDHIHLLLEIPPTYALSDFMRELKISARNYIEANAQLFPSLMGGQNLMLPLPMQWEIRMWSRITFKIRRNIIVSAAGTKKCLNYSGNMV